MPGIPERMPERTRKKKGPFFMFCFVFFFSANENGEESARTAAIRSAGDARQDARDARTDQEVTLVPERDAETNGRRPVRTRPFVPPGMPRMLERMPRMPRMPQMPGMRPVDRCRSVASAEPTGNDEHPTRKKKIIIIQRNHWIRFLFFSFLACFFLGSFFF